MEKTAEGLVAYAKAQLGKPYWYGTFGQHAHRELYEQKKRQYPKQYTWEYDGTTEKVHDCVGLIKGYLWGETEPVYNAAQDQSANGMYAACKTKGEMPSMPEMPGILVFFPGHVGVYIGDGRVIEARSRRYGVYETKLTERPWETWGYCPYIRYENKLVSMALPVLKKGAKGESVQALQHLLTGNGYTLEPDGSFGGATDGMLRAYQRANDLETDGSCGKKTWEKLLGLK